MKLAYLILAHKQPKQLLRLISKLNLTSVKFFVHIDTYSNFDEFDEVLKNISELTLISEYRTSWGSFNIVKAELVLIEKAYQWGADRFVLLSGQDYPIKSAPAIKNFYTKNNNIAFVEFTKMPDKDWNEHQNGLFRINRFHFRFINSWRALPPHSKKIILNPLFNFMARFTFLVFFKSKYVKNYWHGSQWWSLNRDHIKFVLENVPNYLRSFKNSYVADESFFQSIIANAPEKKFVIKNSDLHYIKWPRKKSSSPQILCANDFDEIINSNELFIRKVDEIQSKELMDKIDEVFDTE